MWKFLESYRESKRKLEVKQIEEELGDQTPNESPACNVVHTLEVVFQNEKTTTYTVKNYEDPGAPAQKVYEKFYNWFTKESTPWFEMEHANGMTMLRRDLIIRVEFVRSEEEGK